MTAEMDSTQKQKHAALGVTLKSARADQLTSIYELLKHEDWSPRLEKLQVMYQENPNTFFVLVNGDGHLVASMSLTMNFSEEYLIGSVIVKEPFRGLGLGRKMVTEVTQNFIPHKTVSLLSVPSARGFYTKLGFHLCEPQQSHVFNHLEVNMSRVESKMADLSEELKDIRVFAFESSRLNEMVKYGHAVHGFNTTAQIKSVVDYCHVLLVENTSSRQIVGYAAPYLKNKNKEIRFDGLYADSEAIALALFSACLHYYPDIQKVKLEMLESRQFLSQFGEIKDKYTYLKYAYGSPTPVLESKCFSTSDNSFCP